MFIYGKTGVNMRFAPTDKVCYIYVSDFFQKLLTEIWKSNSQKSLATGDLTAMWKKKELNEIISMDVEDYFYITAVSQCVSQ